MTSHRHLTISRASAEALLEGRLGGPPRLGALLRASRAPACAAELMMPPHVLLEWRAVHSAGAHSPGPRARRGLAGRLVASKVALAAALIGFATSGVALAAATGNLPAPLQHVAHDAFGAPDGKAESAGWPGFQPAGAHGPNAPADPAGRPSDTPRPSLSGLCTAYRAGVGTHQPRVLDNPAFTALITAAGGRAQVASFCVDLIGPAPAHPGGGQNNAHPGAPSTSGAAHRAHPSTARLPGNDGQGGASDPSDHGSQGDSSDHGGQGDSGGQGDPDGQGDGGGHEDGGQG